jgi:FMN phosphatase YigB (HAD superfamily)
LLVYSQQQERDHVISLLPNGQSEEIYENVDEAVKELKNLKKEIKDIIIIRNGKEI